MRQIISAVILIATLQQGIHAIDNCQTHANSNTQCTACNTGYFLYDAGSKLVTAANSPGVKCMTCSVSYCLTCHANASLVRACATCQDPYSTLNETLDSKPSDVIFNCLQLDPLYSMLRLVMAVLLVCTMLMCVIFVVLNRSMVKDEEISSTGKNMDAVGPSKDQAYTTPKKGNDNSMDEQEKNFFETSTYSPGGQDLQI